MTPPEVNTRAVFERPSERVSSSSELTQRARKAGQLSAYSTVVLPAHPALHRLRKHLLKGAPRVERLDHVGHQQEAVVVARVEARDHLLVVELVEARDLARREHQAQRGERARGGLFVAHHGAGDHGVHLRDTRAQRVPESRRLLVPGVRQLVVVGATERRLPVANEVNRAHGLRLVQATRAVDDDG